MALPTRGRVIIDTTAGELDIELWSRECPKACRNFITLAMEGYYDGVVFHRIVPDFLVQTGDRTGTGGGGESCYGEQFEDEIHPRLRFSHRGLLACANNGGKNSNDSQFFITLDRADELHGKHTLFGRCVGDTIYNVVKIGAMEIDKDGRPVYPPKIKTVRIIDNPFDDIVPRITAEEKRAQQRAREQAQREREEAEKRKGAKKDIKLLSFAGDDDEQNEEVVMKKKSIVRPDLLDNPEESFSIPDFVSEPPSRSNEDHKSQPKMEKPSLKKDDIEVEGLREKHAKEQFSKLTARQKEIAQMEAEIRQLSKRTAGGLNDSDDEDAQSKKKSKTNSYLKEELSKYSKGRLFASKVGKKKKDESDVLAALNNFRGMLQSSNLDRPINDHPTEAEEAVNNEEGMEVDTDQGFLGHLLTFPKDNDEEVAKAERDYEVIDPRERGARAKQEERDRRNATGRGRGRHRR